MRSVTRTKRFKRDFKRVKRGVHAAHIDDTLLQTVELLVADEELPPSYSDHSMKGSLNDCRDCHLRSDLTLIYRKAGADTLELVRIGTHTQLEI